MGKKYIIEIPEDKIADFVGSTHFLMPYMMAGHIGHHDTGLPIKPYTEPDLEQVRKEAYRQGYDTGYGTKVNEFYEQGLFDAWEAARDIHRMPDGDILDLFPDCYASVCTAAQAILKYDASEAIAKIKEYEDGKQEYHVGDEFENGAGRKFVVLKMDGKEIDRYIDSDGKTYVMKLKYGVMRKTGRHFPEIAAVLKKMRGDQK